MPEEYIPFQNNLKKNELLYLNFFWAGFILFALGGIIASSDVISLILCQAIQLFGFVLMLVTSIFLVRVKIDSSYLGTIFILYLIWCIITIFRQDNLSFNLNLLKSFLFGGGNGGLIYITPLILLFPRNFSYYKKLFEVIILCAILYLLLDIVFIKKLLIRGEDYLSQGVMESLYEIAVPSAFILLTFLYHSNKKNLIALATIVITSLLIIIRARRGLIFITSSLIIFCFLFYFFGTRKKILLIYLTALGFVCISLYAANLYSLQKSFLGFLIERGGEDTRTVVELNFYDDMKPDDWALGRGINGEYFSPNIEEYQLTNYRSVIETGYLQIILKGGIISLLLLLLILVPAIILGVFYSNNILSKAAGIWIFQSVIDLYPQNSVTFNLSYLIVWIGVGICYSDKIRKMSNRDIKNELYLSNYKIE